MKDKTLLIVAAAAAAFILMRRPAGAAAPRPGATAPAGSGLAQTLGAIAGIFSPMYGGGGNSATATGIVPDWQTGFGTASPAQFAAQAESDAAYWASLNVFTGTTGDPYNAY